MFNLLWCLFCLLVYGYFDNKYGRAKDDEKETEHHKDVELLHALWRHNRRHKDNIINIKEVLKDD